MIEDNYTISGKKKTSKYIDLTKAIRQGDVVVSNKIAFELIQSGELLGVMELLIQLYILSRTDDNGELTE